jgi:D-glucosaminate-6-phosphate ammonia-lyase
VRPPQRGGPFPTLNVSWDQSQVGLTAGDVGRQLLEGQPRIASHAAGEGNNFLIRPAAMRPDDYKAVATRLAAIFRAAPKGLSKSAPAAPAADLSGRWDVHIQYQSGEARHKLFLSAKGNRLTGTHIGWSLEGECKGSLDAAALTLQSVLPTGGQRLQYTFTGKLTGANEMSGELALGEYGRATWTARRHNAG